MGLLSRFKQKKASSDSHDSGEFRSRSEEDSIQSRSRGKKSENARKSKVNDPVLPEKKRARRRLIGATALALTAIIGLPMVFDSEPKPLPDDIAIRIPSKDKMPELEAVKPAEPAPPRKNNIIDVDPNEEIIDPVSPANSPSKTVVKTAESPRDVTPLNVTEHAPQKTETEAPAKVDAKVPTSVTEKTLESKPSLKTDSKTDKKTDTKAESKSDAKSEAKTNARADVKVDGKQESKSESKSDAKSDTKSDAMKVTKQAPDDDAARAMAILEGKAPAKSTATKAADSEHSSYVVQVAALATQEKVDELQSKLKSANIKSYTQKVATSSGDKIRIRVGPFESKEEADKMRAKLVKLGLNGSLVPN